MKPHTSYAPVSDPSRVMEMISASRADRPAPLRSGTQLLNNARPAISNRRSASGHPPHLRLHVEEQTEPMSWSTAPAQVCSQQVEQLVQHLRQRQRELDQREADLQASVYRLEQQAISSQAQFRKRNAELEQHLNQVKLQQAQLFKLQQNMIETQTALRQVIEQIVDKCEPSQLKQELQKLKFELSESLDAILTRWERLKPRIA